MAALTDVQLKAIMPAAPDLVGWCHALNEAMIRFEINSPARVAAFLAQVAHESGELRRLVENLSYTAKRLVDVWPKRFPTLAQAQPFERQPERLANRVYANRLGNGDEASGDGWRFRGRGLLQITGRGNYRSCGAALGLPLEGQPELLETPVPAAAAAAQFWKSRGLNELADDRNDDNDDEDFVTITVIINGGKNGLTDRRAYWQRAKTVLI
jgi:putative chitinase